VVILHNNAIMKNNNNTDYDISQIITSIVQKRHKDKVNKIIRNTPVPTIYEETEYEEANTKDEEEDEDEDEDEDEEEAEDEEDNTKDEDTTEDEEEAEDEDEEANTKDEDDSSVNRVTNMEHIKRLIASIKTQLSDIEEMI